VDDDDTDDVEYEYDDDGGHNDRDKCYRGNEHSYGKDYSDDHND